MDKKHKCKICHFLYAMLIFFFVTTLSLSLQWKPIPMGECDEYMLPTIALINHYSHYVYPEDVAEAKRVFPEEMGNYLEWSYNHGGLTRYTDGNGGKKPFYFWTYSLIVIPVYLWLGFFHLPQIYAFPITNAILYAIALWGVIRFTTFPGTIKAGLVALLMFNPALFYISWESAEICIFSFVVLALAFWQSKHHHFAAIFVSLAGTLNPTIMVLGMVMIVNFLYDRYKSYQTTKKIDYNDICAYILCYGLSIIPFVYNAFCFGVLNVAAEEAMDQYPDWKDEYFGRIFSYLFDLNLGIFPYEPIALIMFILLSILMIIRNQNRHIMSYFVAFIGVLSAFSLMSHISCGMSGIARYNIWLIPIMLFGLTEIFQSFQKRKSIINMIGIGGLLFSVIWIVLIFKFYHVGDPYGTKDNDMVPLARLILQTNPSFYNPLKSIFIWRSSRKTTIKNMYSDSYRGIAVYRERESGCIRKILCSKSMEDILFDELLMDEVTEKNVRKQLENGRNAAYTYINIPPPAKVKYSAFALLKQADISINRLRVTGKYNLNQDGVVTIPPNELQYGPYVTLAKGKYIVKMEGKNLLHAVPKVTGDCGGIEFPIEVIHKTDNVMKYYVTLAKDTQWEIPNVEFVNKNPTATNMYINSLTVDMAN